MTMRALGCAQHSTSFPPAWREQQAVYGVTYQGEAAEDRGPIEATFRHVRVQELLLHNDNHLGVGIQEDLDELVAKRFRGDAADAPYFAESDYG